MVRNKQGVEIVEIVDSSFLNQEYHKLNEKNEYIYMHRRYQDTLKQSFQIVITNNK